MLSVKQPTYLEPQAFAAYCQGPIQNVLSLLSLKLGPNSMKLKQVAARALGYSCFEALVSRWTCKQAIADGFYAANCPIQDDRLTLKAKNIVIVYDPKANCLIAMALRPGEEGRRLSVEWAECDDGSLLYLPKNIFIDEEFDIIDQINSQGDPNALSIEESITGTFRAVLPYRNRRTHKLTGAGIVIMRTHEGIIIDYYDEDMNEVEDSIGVMFTDRQESENGHEHVNLFNPELPFSGAYGTYYQWLKPGVDDADNDRLYPINPDEEFDVSSLHFNTADEAIAAILSGDWGTDGDSMTEEGAVLVKTTRQIVPSPF